MRRGTLAILLALLCATQGLSALGFTVDLGWGGRAVPGRWLPLRLSLDGGPADAVVDVTRLDADGGEGATETFIPGGQGEVECPVFIDPAFPTLRIRVLSGKEVLAERLVFPLARSFPGHVVLAVGLPDAALRGLALALEPLEPVLAVKAGTRDLPALALELDAVAGIAMRDTGDVLSPSQKAALSSWVAAGGRVLVLGARPGGLAEGLGCPPPAAGGRAFSAQGYGAVVALAGQASPSSGLDGGAFWRRELGLEPFGADRRISAGRLARVSGPAPSVPSRLFSLDPLLAALAAAWVLALVLLQRSRRGFLLSAVLSAILAVAALPAARALDAARLGLSHASTRVLILPDGSFLAENTLSALNPTWTLDPGGLVPARSLSFSTEAGEAGHVGPGAMPPRLVHDGPVATSSILRYGRSSTELVTMTGPRPNRPAASASAFATRAGSAIVLVRGGKPGLWYLPSVRGWTESRLEPAFLSWDSAWVATLRDEYPDYDFAVGRSEAGPSAPAGLAGMRLRIAGGRAPTVLWAVAYRRDSEAAK